MTRDAIYNQIKKLQLVEQVDIAIDILVYALKFTGANEQLLTDELKQIKKIIANPSDHIVGVENE